MNIKKQKLAQLFLIGQFLWSSVYTPVAYAQVPAVGSKAGDWNVYQQIIDEEKEFINLLLILDTSDSMNQPESWRPYPGGYNSHIEYLWNDPRFIDTIAVAEPIAPVRLSSLTSADELKQVRRGYWSFRLTDADNSILDPTTRQNNRIQLRDAARADANQTVNLSFHPTESTSNVISVPKSVYRNYGGSVTESEQHRDLNMWFDSSWIYWVRSGTVDHTNIYQSPYLYSTSFSRFRGASSSIAGTRATIPYYGDIHYGAFNDIEASGTYHPITNMERFNLCETSKYNESSSKLTGLGVIAEGIKPSTTYAPAWSRQSKKDSSNILTNQAVTPITLFNLGYAKNLNMVRFDPYYYATQTRRRWLDSYPGAGLVDSFDTVWPPVSNIDNNHYFIEADWNRFQPGYLDLRCWDNNGVISNPSRSLLSNPACKYEIINPPARDNFFSSKSTDGNFSNSNPYNKNQVFGTTGQPIRVLRQRFINGVAVDNNGNVDPNTNVLNVAPRLRKYDIAYGNCGNIANTVNTKNYDSATISVGGYTDYICADSDPNLRMGWTKLYSDSGGFIHARALYQMATQLIHPATITNRASVIENMLKVYQVNEFTSTSTRWGRDNTNTQITPRLIDRVLFSGWLGTRDCFEHPSLQNTEHCRNVPSLAEYATGTPAYFDSTRSTFHYWERPGGAKTDSRDTNCYTALGAVIPCTRFVNNSGNFYDTDQNWFNPVKGRSMEKDDFYDPGSGYSPIGEQEGCYIDRSETALNITEANCNNTRACKSATDCNTTYVDLCYCHALAGTCLASQNISWFQPYPPADRVEVNEQADGTCPTTHPFRLPTPVWAEPQAAVQVRSAPRPYIRTGTYLLNDPNSNTNMIDSSFGYGNILYYDSSDTRGDVWPNNIDNASRGAEEILKEKPKIRRRVSCVANTGSIQYAATEAPQATNQPNQWFTNYTCSPATNYDATADCQVYNANARQWVGVGNSVPGVGIVRQGMCEQYSLPDPVCEQPKSAGGQIRKYSSGACDFFSYRANFEGINNVISRGLSCSPIEGNDIYIIDWTNSYSNDNDLITKYQNWLNAESGNIGTTVTLPGGIVGNYRLRNIANIASSAVGTDCLQVNRRWSPPSARNLCQMNDGESMESTLQLGNLFEHGFYTTTAGNTNRIYRNTGVNNTASCQAINPNIDLDSIACYTPSTTTPSHNNGYLVVTGQISVPAAQAHAVANASCSEGTSDASFGINRSSQEYGGWLGELPFYVFEAYNVDKFGTWRNLNDAHNFGSLFADNQNGRYMPHLFHQCVEDDSNIGVGKTAIWTTTTNQLPNKTEFTNLYKFAEQATEYVKVATPSEDPRTALSIAYQNSSTLSSTDASNVDLYSANYLNFVFGPKYQGAPIGRRTRIQVAQDVLAQVIASTTKNVRIGLMAFSYPVNNRTQGGYVVRKINTLDKVSCYEQNLEGSLAADLKTITLTNGPSTWIEMIPQPNGTTKMPDDFIESIVDSGGVVFANPNYQGTNYPPVSVKSIDNTLGTIVLNSPAPIATGTVTFILQDCYMPNYPDLAQDGHRKKLIDSLYSLKAVSQTPLTETLYEAYLYFTGETPEFGRKSVADSEAFIGNNYSTGDYYSPMKSLVDELNDPEACMMNFILLVTDGYPFDDTTANQEISGLHKPGFLSYSTRVATNLANDTSGLIAQNEKIITNVFDSDPNSTFPITQFMDPSTNDAYGYFDQKFNRNNSSLFDELAYFLGNADLSVAGVNSRQNIGMSVITMDVDCAPVIKNGLKRNNGSQCNTVFTSKELLDALKDLFNSINRWIPSASAVSVPLPTTNRASSSTDVYIGLFRPQNLQVWSGNLKKYKLAFGPKECGFDINYNPVDVCMISKFAIKTYFVNGVTVKLRNALTRPSTENDLTFHNKAVDFFSTASRIANEGLDPLAGGINSHYQDDGYPAPNSGNVYTFLSGTSQANKIDPKFDLTHNQNRVTTTNTTLLNYDSFDFGSGQTLTGTDLTNQVTQTVRFMLGATPSSAATTNPTLRINAHGDVLHSNPVTITYTNNNHLYTRLFYQTGFGDLVSVEDTNTSNNDANSGTVQWRFYPEESLQKQILLHRSFGLAGGDRKMFGSDGAITQLIFDKNKDGFVDSNHDKVYIAFGMRRGGRAVYVLDVTNPNSPKLQWKIANDSFCTFGDSSASSFTCIDAANLTTGSGGIPAGIPNDFLDELGYTWSVPVLGFVNHKPLYTNVGLQNIVDIKNGLQPVAIFGGGYDPEEDNKTRDPSNLSMGRAFYIVDALTGIPIKMWFRQGNKTTNNPTGGNPSSYARVGKFARYINSGNCKNYEYSNSSSTNNVPFYYPIASNAYAFNVDFDTQNTFDRIYIGDLGGQVWRFDIGDKNKDNWVGYLFEDLNMNIARSDDKSDNDQSNPNNLVNGVRKKTRKIFFPPVRVGWKREDISYDYIFIVTGDIEHPTDIYDQDIMAVALDPEVGITSRCAPFNELKLRDITNVGRIDRNDDGKIDKDDLPKAATSNANFPITYENIVKSPYTISQIRDKFNGVSTTYSRSEGTRGWYYRMERGEKAASQPRVINGVLSWTAFAPRFSALPCSRGTGTKYYLDAFYGTTVDTNLDGEVNNCLKVLDETNAINKSHSRPSSAFSGITTSPSAMDKISDDLENVLRTPEFLQDKNDPKLDRITPTNRDKAGSRSIHCDSPRPIYNTSYGLLPADNQVVHDGKIYRVGFVPQGNSIAGVYDEELDFLGPDYQSSQPSSGVGGGGGSSRNPLSTSPSSWGPSSDPQSTINSIDQAGSTSYGSPEGNTPRPAPIYWFRDDLQ